MRKTIITAAVALTIATLGTTMTSFGQTSNQLQQFAYDDTPWEQVAGRSNVWFKSDGSWHWIDEYGQVAYDRWIRDRGTWYRVGEWGNMLWDQWYYESGNWYFFNGSGAMVTNQWQITNGEWYYLQSDGTMMTNAYTPDGYYVGSDGVWEQNNSQNESTSSRDLLSFSSKGYVADMPEQPYAYRSWLTLNQNGTFVLCMFDEDYQSYTNKGNFSVDGSTLILEGLSSNFGNDVPKGNLESGIYDYYFTIQSDGSLIFKKSDFWLISPDTLFYINTRQ